jgi:hypothetical protein
MPPPDGSPVVPRARTLTGSRPPRREDRAAQRTIAGTTAIAATARAPPRAGSAPATVSPIAATAAPVASTAIGTATWPSRIRPKGRRSSTRDVLGRSTSRRSGSSSVLAAT